MQIHRSDLNKHALNTKYQSDLFSAACAVIVSGFQIERGISPKFVWHETKAALHSGPLGGG
jgi:hypothetical protein